MENGINLEPAIVWIRSEVRKRLDLLLPGADGRAARDLAQSIMRMAQFATTVEEFAKFAANYLNELKRMVIAANAPVVEREYRRAMKELTSDPRHWVTVSEKRGIYTSFDFLKKLVALLHTTIRAEDRPCSLAVIEHIRMLCRQQLGQPTAHEEDIAIGMTIVRRRYGQPRLDPLFVAIGNAEEDHPDLEKWLFSPEANE